MKKEIVLSLAACCATLLSACSKDASAVGIIGGSDGPTAIFMTNMAASSVMGIVIPAAIVVVLVVGGVVLYLRGRKRK